MKSEILAILDNAKKHPINKEETLFLLQNTEDQENAEYLFEVARFVREAEKGNVFRITGGIAQVLKCNLKPLCTYCPYWREKGKKPLSTKEVLKAVRYLHDHGIRDFHLSGGTTLGSEGKDVLALVKSIYDAGFTDMAIDINCGAAMSLETLLELKQYGVKMVRSVFETLNPKVFSFMKPGDSLEAKKDFAWRIGEAGIALGTGMLAGLSPQDTRYQDYVDFLFEIKEFPHLKSVYVSKFYPFGTIALQGYEPCPSSEAARVIALARLILRTVDIGAAQGWMESKVVTPFDAGAGNGTGGIHITRTPAYIDTAKQGPHVTYKDNMEYRNNIESIRGYYEERGIELVF